MSFFYASLAIAEEIFNRILAALVFNSLANSHQNFSKYNNNTESHPIYKYYIAVFQMDFIL